MPRNLLDRYGTSYSAKIKLAGLATSATKVGRQSDVIDWSNERYPLIQVAFGLKQGTSPTGRRGGYLWLVRGDGRSSTPHYDDNAAEVDGALTFKNSMLMGVLSNGTSPSTGDILKGTFIAAVPGPKFILGASHDTGVNLSSDDSEVTNGAFAADTDWTKDAGWTISSGQAHASANDSISQACLVIGSTYRITFTVANYLAGNVRIEAGTTQGTPRSANGTYVEDLVCAGNTSLKFTGASSPLLSIDNVEAILLDPNPVNYIRYRGINPELVMV